MDKKKILGVGTIAVALILSVVSVTVVFAAFNAQLDIKGSASTKGARWGVVFSDLKTAQTGNDNGVTSTATEITAPRIEGQASIETYEVQLQTPGDYISYRFTITNSGDFPAKIDTSFAMPTPTCTKGTGGTDTDATNVCNNLEYTLKYVEDSAPVQAGDTFAINESKEVELKIYYKKTVTTDLLPSADVAIGNLNIAIPFVQY